MRARHLFTTLTLLLSAQVSKAQVLSAPNPGCWTYAIISEYGKVKNVSESFLPANYLSTFSLTADAGMKARITNNLENYCVTCDKYQGPENLLARLSCLEKNASLVLSAASPTIFSTKLKFKSVVINFILQNKLKGKNADYPIYFFAPQTSEGIPYREEYIKILFKDEFNFDDHSNGGWLNQPGLSRFIYEVVLKDFPDMYEDFFDSSLAFHQRKALPYVMSQMMNGKTILSGRALALTQDEQLKSAVNGYMKEIRSSLIEGRMSLYSKFWMAYIYSENRLLEISKLVELEQELVSLRTQTLLNSAPLAISEESQKMLTADERKTVQFALDQSNSVNNAARGAIAIHLNKLVSQVSARVDLTTRGHVKELIDMMPTDPATDLLLMRPFLVAGQVDMFKTAVTRVLEYLPRDHFKIRTMRILKANLSYVVKEAQTLERLKQDFESLVSVNNNGDMSGFNEFLVKVSEDKTLNSSSAVNSLISDLQSSLTENEIRDSAVYRKIQDSYISRLDDILAKMKSSAQKIQTAIESGGIK